MSRQCTMCPLSFPCPAKLSTHIEYVHKGLSYICTLCGYFSRNNSVPRFHPGTHGLERNEMIVEFYDEKSDNRRSHKTTTSIAEMPCIACPASFQNKLSIVNHVTCVHKGRKFRCKVCNAIVSSHNDLLPHVKAHEKKQ